jgi:phage gpG-like protein
MTNLARFENEYKDIIRRAYATTENEAALNMAIGGRPSWLDESDEPTPQGQGGVTFSWE